MKDKEVFFDWGAFTPESAAGRLPVLLAGAEREIAALEASEPAGYEQFVWRLDDATRPLIRCWGAVSHMLGVMNSDAWRKLEEEWQGKIVEFSLRVGQSKRLYEIAKSLLSGSGVSDPTRRRVLEKMVQKSELDGVALEGASRERFNEIQTRLAKLEADFHNAVIDATKAFKFEKGGKTYTIDDASYPETMKNCADREVRELLFRARATRAPENARRIDEILRLRQETAGLLGFASYADKSLATKCAPSVAAAIKMIDDLDEATCAAAESDEAELREAAASCGVSDMKPWDRTYFSERLRERRYAYSEEELKRHFEMESVVAGLFRLTKFLFGVDVEEVVGDAKPSVWHPDVRFFAVKEGGETVAHFYFDPFVRNGQKFGGAWVNDLSNRRVTQSGTVLPQVIVVTNFPERDEKGKCLLSMREVETVFHEFGHALQAMLTRVDEEEASGTGLVEWDAVEIASQFMENWCLDDRTGIEVPADLKAKVRAAKTFRAATACRRQLAFAKTDLELHMGPVADADAVKRRLFDHFGMHSVEDDCFLCAFSHIFSGGYAAGYYGYKWSEVMSADCYGAFEDAGLGDDEALRRVGERYRETILALGGSRRIQVLPRTRPGDRPASEDNGHIGSHVQVSKWAPSCMIGRIWYNTQTIIPHRGEPMKFEGLMQQFGAKFGIAEVAIEDDSAAFEIDGMAFGFICDPAAETLTVVADLGQKSINVDGAFGSLMLKANFLFEATKGATLFQNPENESFGLQQRYRLAELDLDALSAEVEKLANVAEEWKGLLAGSATAEAALKERKAEDVSEAASLSGGAFMRV